MSFYFKIMDKAVVLASRGVHSVPLISLLCNSLEDNSWPFHILSRNITKNVAVQLTDVFLDPKPIVFYADMIRAPPKTKCLRSSAKLSPHNAQMSTDANTAPPRLGRRPTCSCTFNRSSPCAPVAQENLSCKSKFVLELLGVL